MPRSLGRRRLEGVALATATLALLLGLLESGFRVFGIYAGTHYIGRRIVVRSPDERL